jgi:ubiquinone/menaquinone biosynthesis C-methylase UbiE
LLTVFAALQDRLAAGHAGVSFMSKLNVPLNINLGSRVNSEVSIVTEEQSQYWSKVAQKYDQVVDLQIGGKTRSLIREKLANEGTLGTLVEFGCGTGFYTGVLAEKGDRIVATDISPGMLAVAKKQIKAENVKFQLEDCQKTSFPDGAFDTAFMSLVIHFTEPEKTLVEMARILKPGGILIITNLDPLALNALNRIRCIARVIYHGLVRYRVKPPKGSADHLLTEEQLCGLLRKSGFTVLDQETIRDTSRSSNIPVEYIRAVK